MDLKTKQYKDKLRTEELRLEAQLDLLEMKKYDELKEILESDLQKIRTCLEN